MGYGGQFFFRNGFRSIKRPTLLRLLSYPENRVDLQLAGHFEAEERFVARAPYDHTSTSLAEDHHARIGRTSSMPNGFVGRIPMSEVMETFGPLSKRAQGPLLAGHRAGVSACRAEATLSGTFEAGASENPSSASVRATSRSKSGRRSKRNHRLALASGRRANALAS